MSEKPEPINKPKPNRQMIKNKDYFDTLVKIADRMERELSVEGLEFYDRTSFIMDLDSVEQSHDLNMDWEKMLNADKSNFMHDAIGISNHMDRSSFPGKLTNCFLPRFAT